MVWFRSSKRGGWGIAEIAKTEIYDIWYEMDLKPAIYE